jgi:hypothetical protein
MNDDRDLRNAFKALGGNVGTAAPSFDELASPAALNTARWRRRRRRAALAFAAIAIPSVFVFRSRADRALDYERFTALTGLDLGKVTWEAPSDFLLDVPGRELLRGVPTIEIRTPILLPDSTRGLNSNDTNRRSPS